MSVIAIRGATTCDDNVLSVNAAVKELLTQITQKNNLGLNQIISVFFTATKDISSCYPAVAAREFGITEAGIMCMQEMYVENSTACCIRVLLHINTDSTDFKPKHIYLKGASNLRPDWEEQ